MKGTLHKSESGWVVKYWDNDPHYKGNPGSIKQVIEELEVTPMSLSNPDLSTYWVDGREVNFVPYYTHNPKQAIVLKDEETWDDIFKKVYEDDSIVEFHQIFTWLKENYQTPKRK